MVTAGQFLKRIPRIKFPQRHPRSSGSASQNQHASKSTNIPSSDVPAPPRNTAFGGKASLQPKRTPVSDKEIEAIMQGGCF